MQYSQVRRTCKKSKLQKVKLRQGKGNKKNLAGESQGHVTLNTH